MTDTPTPTLNPPQEVERNFRWNFTVNALDGASFWLGMSFISSTVILPLYVSRFTDNPFLIGLIPFIATSSYLIPQLFTANWVERAPVKKYFPVTLGFFLERLPIFLMAPSAYFLAASQPMLALLIFFLCFAWHGFGAGFVIVGWQDMVAKIIPVDKRGRFLGLTNFLGNGTGILGAIAVPFVLNRFAFPNGYVIAFTAASILIFLSWVFLSLTREPAVPSSKPPVSQLDYLRTLPDVLRKDRNFCMYLLAQIVYTLSGMATGFLVVYTVQTWGLTDAEASGYTIALQVGLAVANLFFGFFSDRKGNKLSLEICLLLVTAVLVIAIIAPSPLWFFPVFFLRGAVNAGMFISGISIVYEFTDAENRPTYIGLANTIPGIVGAIAPMIGGWMVGTVSYQAMFVLAALFGAAGWALLRFAVCEPRKLVQDPEVTGAVPTGG